MNNSTMQKREKIDRFNHRYENPRNILNNYLNGKIIQIKQENNTN